MREVKQKIAPTGFAPRGAGEPVRAEQSATPAPAERGSDVPAPFTRRITQSTPGFLVDEILPPAALLEFVSVDVLNCYINYVELRAVITERDPEEEERHISMSNRFYTHFHEFGTVIHVIAASAKHWWYFCYDIDASDCAIGRVEIARATLPQMKSWVMSERVSKRYPVVEIDVKNLQGWRSFQ
jgi:hypothetical protein